MTQQLRIRSTPCFQLAGLLTLSLILHGCGLVLSDEKKLDRAQTALEEGDFRTAIIDARDVLRGDGNNLRGRLILARASLSSSDSATAVKEFERALELGEEMPSIASDFAKALLLNREFNRVIEEIPLEPLANSDDAVSVRSTRGDAYLNLGDPVNARAEYSSALSIDESNLKALIGYSNTYLAEQNYIQSSSIVDNLLAHHSESYEAWLYAGSFRVQVGDLQHARSDFEKALTLASPKENAQRHQVISALTDVSIESGDLDAAREYLVTLEEEAPNTFQTRFLIARLAFAERDWEVAHSSLQEVLKIGPDFRPAQIMFGVVQLNRGNLRQAEDYLSRAVASAPEDPRARQLLAEVQIRLSNTSEAQKLIEPLLANDQIDPLTLQMAARASLMQEDPERAIGFLKRNVDINPGVDSFKYDLVMALLEMGRTSEADQILDGMDPGVEPGSEFRKEALKVLSARRAGNDVAIDMAKVLRDNYSDLAESHGLVGIVSLSIGDIETARASFKRALEVDSGYIVAYRYLGAIEEQSQNLDVARELYDKALQTDNNAGWAHFAKGRVAVRDQDLDTAASSFAESFRLQPENERYLNAYVKALAEGGDIQFAISRIEEIGDEIFVSKTAAVELGVLYLRVGKNDEARDVANRLILDNPADALGYALSGEVEIAEQNIDAAISSYDRALELGTNRNHALRAHFIQRQDERRNPAEPLVAYLEAEPGDLRVRAILAEYYQLNNLVPAAIEHYEAISAANPDNAVILNNLAFAYLEAGDVRAREVAYRAYELQPDSGPIADTLGWVLVQLGEVEEGEELLRRAVELENGRAEVRYHHAVALAELGRTGEARTVISELLASDEEFSSRNDAEQYLGNLGQ